MDRLWTPWRYDYIANSFPQGRKGVPKELEAWPQDRDTGCVFCNLIASADYAMQNGMPPIEADRAAHIVRRGTFCFTCLNAFPYSSGHVLILPYRHCASLAALDPPSAEELILTAQQIETALRAVYHPDGLNLGINLGQAAGAGVAGHLHLHALPRWVGDSNFMTVTAETRILPETLDITWTRLRQALDSLPKTPAPPAPALTVPAEPASPQSS